jgi:hypothetical protein
MTTTLYSGTYHTFLNNKQLVQKCEKEEVHEKQESEDMTTQANNK